MASPCSRPMSLSVSTSWSTSSICVPRPAQQALTRAVCAVRIRDCEDTDSRDNTEGQPEFPALHRSGRLFDDFLHDDANISSVAG